MTATERQIRDLCATLRKTDWVDVERQTIAALNRDRRGGGRIQPDGYPSSTMSDGPGGAELTSVESATERRLFAKPERDVLHDSVKRVCDELQKAAFARDALVARLGLIASQLEEAPPDTKFCEVCKPAGFVHPPEHFGNIKGKLPRHMHHCDPVAKYVSRHKKRPTEDQIRHYWGSGKNQWRVTVDPKAALK